MFCQHLGDKDRITEAATTILQIAFQKFEDWEKHSQKYIISDGEYFFLLLSLIYTSDELRHLLQFPSMHLFAVPTPSIFLSSFSLNPNPCIESTSLGLLSSLSLLFLLASIFFGT